MYNDRLIDILEYIILYWYRNFEGINGIEIAQKFNIPHSESLNILDELEKLGKGKVKRDVELYTMIYNIKNTNNKIDFEKKVTSIFFPSSEILTNYFHDHEYSKKNIPIYTARLYKGGSQLQTCYFNNEVLQRYIAHPEYFDIENMTSGGHIQLNPQYIKGLSKEELDKIEFPLIRFGKRKLSTGSVSIAVILIDLSKLSEKEQHYWYSHELENPEFSKNDKDYNNFLGRNFLGQFLDDDDPLKNVKAEIKRINNLVGGKGLFTIQENYYLTYPVINTLKGFCESCNELYKLIGPDSLNSDKLELLLQEHFKFSHEDFIDKNTQRPIGKLNLLGKLCKNLDCDKLYDLIKNIKEYRGIEDHQAINPMISDENYIEMFKMITDELSINLNVFAEKLESLITQ